MQNVIRKNEIPWQNILDENGLESHKNNIKSFPTKFLLDSNGKIIKKNISIEDLEKFLEENIKMNFKFL